uniref:Uncharacterized protein n=1 Tax=Ananas comosus var. bracteatus TaxID=296719 RepID=A0A6V7NN13_ANACO|nr:unnamed protein product [Ananas comosus var. bracteatus]
MGATSIESKFSLSYPVSLEIIFYFDSLIPHAVKLPINIRTYMDSNLGLGYQPPSPLPLALGTIGIMSTIQFYQMGYIKLACPVTHVWYLKRLLSYIANFLDKPLKQLEGLVPFDTIK